MFRIVTAALIAAAIALPATAQTVCGKRSDVLQQLSTKYSEMPAAMGLSNDGGVIEVLTSPDGHTWTIIVTKPDGSSCLVIAGEYWEAAPRLVKGQKL